MHALVSHRDAVRHRDRAELERDRAGRPHAVLRPLGQPVEGQVARGDLVPGRGHPDLRLVPVVVGQADGAEHRACGRAFHAIGDVPAAWLAVNHGGKRTSRFRAMNELAWLGATAQAELVRNGEVSAKELVEAAITRIEALNPQLDAVTWTRYDEARGEAAGEVTGSFAGVPMLFKDLGCSVAGEPMTFGVGPLRDFRWPVTSYLAEQFRAAGLVNLGRSNVPEMGTTVPTEAKSFPPARNPWNPDHSTGGSSGGAAAAVASGMVPIAHASDGGGSIRIPASECGLVGLKPTRGRVSKGPRGSEGWAGGSIDGVLTRSVRDAAGALDTISASMPG